MESDSLCSDVLTIFCCANKLVEVPSHPGIDFRSTCTNGEMFTRTKLRKLNQMRKKKNAQIQKQDIQPFEALIEYPITSDEIHCSEMFRGKLMRQQRHNKVCCQRPWDKSPWVRKCKECKFNLHLCIHTFQLIIANQSRCSLGQSV